MLSTPAPLPHPPPSPSPCSYTSVSIHQVIHRHTTCFSKALHSTGKLGQTGRRAVQIARNGDRRTQAGVDCQRGRLLQERESAGVLPAVAEAVPSLSSGSFTASTGRLWRALCCSTRSAGTTPPRTVTRTD